MTHVINLFSGAGAGKSTLAAALFSELKIRGLNVELVHEYIKSWAYEQRLPQQLDQLHILGMQSKSESLLYNKVDFIITDSPLLIIPFYEKLLTGRDIVKPAVFNFIKFAKSQGVRYHSFFLDRPENYNQTGRYQTKEEAQSIDKKMALWLTKNKVAFKHLPANHDKRVETILNELKVFHLPKLSK
jgi:nicotinamide riboside kinase